MNCQQLAERIANWHPNASLRDVARMCLLIANGTRDANDLHDESALMHVWNDMILRMQAATDQHAAVLEELNSLSAADPSQLTAENIWTLVRALRVQGQLLNLYLGDVALDASPG
ncbi:MAG: hypothetical protein U0939_08640 [Pirellulales bacterium]